MTESIPENTERKPLFSRDNISAATAVLVFLSSLLIAFTSYQASLIADENRLVSLRATLLGMESAERLAVGQFEADFGFAQAYRLWLELDTLGFLAASEGDFDAADRYDVVRDRVAELSPLLSETYFDPEGLAGPNIEAYESDLYVRDVALMQEQAVDLQERSDVLSIILDTYYRVITITGLLLTILGLSATVFSNLRIRAGFVGLVTVLLLINAVQLSQAVTLEVPERNPEAMEKLADGRAAYHQRAYENAIAAFTEAIDMDANYTEAYVQRGFANRDFYRDASDAPEGTLESAITDLEQAVNAGRAELDVVSQLAELYYLGGRFDDALRTSTYGIENADDFIHHFDAGRAQLVSGEYDAAQVSYDTGFDVAVAQFNVYSAAGQVPPPSFWRFFEIGFLELDFLLLCIDTGDCTEAPPADTLPDDETLVTHASALSTQLKNTSASLELFGMPPQGEAIATVSNLSLTPDDTLFLAEENTFFYGVSRVDFRFDYEGMQEGDIFTTRVYLNDVLYPFLGETMEWEEGDSGTYTFSLRPGEDVGFYQVQFFVNGLLAEQTAFIITFEE